MKSASATPGQCGCSASAYPSYGRRPRCVVEFGPTGSAAVGFPVLIAHTADPMMLAHTDAKMPRGRRADARRSLAEARPACRLRSPINGTVNRLVRLSPTAATWSRSTRIEPQLRPKGRAFLPPSGGASHLAFRQPLTDWFPTRGTRVILQWSDRSLAAFHMPVGFAGRVFERRFSTTEFAQLLPTRHELPDILTKNQEDEPWRGMNTRY